MFESFHGPRNATAEEVAAADEHNRLTLARALMTRPGPERISLLHRINVEALTPDQKLGMVEMWEECKHWLSAQQQFPLASLAETPTQADERWCTWEVSSALRISDAEAKSRINTARELTGRLEDTLFELEDGRISEGQAALIADYTFLLSDEHAAKVQEKVLAFAAEQTRTDTRKALEKAVMEVDPEAAEERRRRRRRERRVERPRPVGDGQSAMWIEGPTEAVVAIFLILTAWAKQMKKHGQVDTIGAGRFDALVGLVFAMAAGDLIARGRANAETNRDEAGTDIVPFVPPPGPVSTKVGLVVRTTTAAGHDDHPADIPGYGPVPASVARRLLAGVPDRDADDTVDDDPWRYDDPEDPDGRWDSGFRPTDVMPSGPRPDGCAALPSDDVQFTMLPVDPTTGWLVKPDDKRLDLGRDRRLASKRQREFIIDRDRECFMVSCHRPAEEGDIDHRDEWGEGGETNVDVLGGGCGHHNRTTKNNGWRIIPGPNGTATLISLLGRRYSITPYRYWDP